MNFDLLYWDWNWVVGDLDTFPAPCNVFHSADAIVCGILKIRKKQAKERRASLAQQLSLAWNFPYNFLHSNRACFSISVSFDYDTVPTQHAYPHFRANPPILPSILSLQIESELTP